MAMIQRSCRDHPINPTGHLEQQLALSKVIFPLIFPMVFLRNWTQSHHLPYHYLILHRFHQNQNHQDYCYRYRFFAGLSQTYQIQLQNQIHQHRQLAFYPLVWFFLELRLKYVLFLLFRQSFLILLLLFSALHLHQFELDFSSSDFAYHGLYLYFLF